MGKTRSWCVLAFVLGALGIGPDAAWAQHMDIHPMGEPVRVGNLTYVVHRAWWDKDLLGLDLTVVNDGPNKAGIPPFKMFDDRGRTYETNVYYQIFPEMSLKPGERESGRIFFTPPKGRTVWFVAPGDFDSGQFAYIALDKVEGK